MRQESYPCSCIICKKSTSSQGIITHHMRSHGSEADKAIWVDRAKATKNAARENRMVAYNLNPVLCQTCTGPIHYDIHKINKFCSSSCAATYTNTNRGYRPSDEHKTKVRVTLLASRIERGWVPKETKGEHCKLNIMTCRHCQLRFVSRTRTTYCNQHLAENRNLKRLMYYFKFNVFNYPELFDLEMLKEKGFYSAGGNNKVVNMEGLARDHRVSVDDAIKNNYDPYYISHLINCQLIPQMENSKKHSKSCITYEQLVQEVEVYDSTN